MKELALFGFGFLVCRGFTDLPARGWAVVIGLGLLAYYAAKYDWFGKMGAKN